MLIANDELRKERLHVCAVRHERHMRDVRAALVQRGALGGLVALAYKYIPAVAALKQADGRLVDVHPEYFFARGRAGAVEVEPLPHDGGLA
jgi:hypothetical protein